MLYLENVTFEDIVWTVGVLNKLAIKQRQFRIDQNSPYFCLPTFESIKINTQLNKAKTKIKSINNWEIEEVI